MIAIAFDTLGASKRLREAGMDERAAEAIVALVQQTTMATDLSQVATKAEISELATKTELKTEISELATKSELKTEISELATKTELKTEIASVRSDLKSEIALVRADMALMESRLRADLSEKIRFQGWAILSGVAVLMTISTALIKLVP